VGLNIHLPGPAELVVVVDVKGAQVNLERAEDLADLQAQNLALGPVDVEFEPGGVRPRAAVEALQSLRFVAAGDDHIADLLQRSQPQVAAILDDELETAGGAQ